MASIKELPTTKMYERIGMHSHVKGLGLDENLNALDIADGLVGQKKAREAAGIIVELVKEGKMAGKAILMAGPPGTGKTAISLAIAKELGEEVPFITLAGSEVFSEEKKKTEVILEAMRKAIGVKITETRTVLEGEVVEFKPNMTASPYNPYQQVVESAVIKLKTTDEEKAFTVGSGIGQALLQQGVAEGDIIVIDKETGRVTKLGRSEDAAKKYDISDEKILPRPSGKVIKDKDFVYVLSLAEIDEINARQRDSFSVFGLFFSSQVEKEIDPEIRMAVDRQVKKWVDEGKAQIIPGVLFIDETHLLDIECYSFLNRALESELSPIVILASNRGFSTIRGTDYKAPHGLPLDLLDRLLIINTEPYKEHEIREIIKIRAKEEKVEFEDEALEELTKIGVEASLRYAIQLIRPAKILADLLKKEKITVNEITRVRNLFSDVESSIKSIKEWENKFMQ